MYAITICAVVLLTLVVFMMLRYNKTPEEFQNDFNTLNKSCDPDDCEACEACEDDVSFFPNKYNLNSEKSCPRLTPARSKYTFRIPQLKYDGIFENDKTSCGSGLKTYSGDTFFHIPKKSLFGKVIVEPPECFFK